MMLLITPISIIIGIIVFIFSYAALKTCSVFSPAPRVIISICVALLSCMSFYNNIGMTNFVLIPYQALGIIAIIFAILWLISLILKKKIKREKRDESTLNDGSGVSNPSLRSPSSSSIAGGRGKPPWWIESAQKISKNSESYHFLQELIRSNSRAASPSIPWTQAKKPNLDEDHLKNKDSIKTRTKSKDIKPI